jgi:hypothetical protein
VVRLGLVSFFADVSSEMLYPITPIFLASVLHAPVEAIGLIEGFAEATASIMRSVFGRLSDRSGRRRPYVVGGYTLAALSKPLIAVAQTWPLVLVARVSDRFGKGMRTPPRDALLADYTPVAERGRAFGWHRAMDSAGAVVGPLIALALISVTNGNLRLVIAMTAVPGLIGAALVLTVREVRGPGSAGAGKAGGSAGVVGVRDLPRPFVAYLAAWAPFALANSSDVSVQDAIVLRRDYQGQLTIARLGTVESKTKVPLRFETSGDIKKLADLWPDSPVLSGRNRKTGEVGLEQLAEVAVLQLPLRSGETRLVGWSDQSWKGFVIRPEANQTVTRTLVLVHLDPGPLPDAEPDQNLYIDVSPTNAEQALTDEDIKPGEGSLDILPQDQEDEEQQQ